MEIKVVSYFDNGTLYFVSDKVLSQCGLLIGVQYTNSSDEVVRCYYYMRKGKGYSYAYDTPVTNYKENGSIFFVGCFRAINKAYEDGDGAVQRLDEKWVRKSRLTNVGTSFNVTDETQDGFREISYTVEFREIESKYGVHQYFGDYTTPISTEKFTPVAGYFTFNANLFANFNLGDEIGFFIDFGNGEDEGIASPSLSMEVRTGNDEILIKSFDYEDISYIASHGDLMAEVSTVEILNSIKNTGIVIFVNSNDNQDWIKFNSIYRQYDSTSGTEIWPAAGQTGGVKTYSGDVFVETEVHTEGTPWIKTKKAQEAAGLLIGIMETGLPAGISNIGYYHIAVGQTEAVPAKAMVLEWDKVTGNRYNRFATLVKSLVYTSGELTGAVLVDNSQVSLSSLWQTEQTRNAYCYGEEVNSQMKYDTYNFVGLVSDAQNILDNADITWTPAAEYDDVIDGVVIDDAHDDTPVVADTHQERNSSVTVFHLAYANTDERVVFDEDSFSKVRTNIFPRTIDPDALYNYDKVAITDIYTLHAGNVLEVSCTQVGEADVVDKTADVKALNVARYKQGIYEVQSMTFPYTATEDEEVVLSVLKYYPYVDLGVKITRAEQTLAVSITPDGRRKKQLMSDDCIEISFVLKKAVNFPVGTYIDDEIFGRFFIVEEQMPTISNGAYQYKLKLEAWYRLWGNKKYMLTQYDDALMSYKRREITWTLTCNLQNHALAVLHNLQAAGYIPVYRDTEVVRTYAKNYLVQYDKAQSEAAVMSKYKMGVGCVLYGSDGLGAHTIIEIGSHNSTVVNPNIFGTVISAKFFSEYLGGNRYIDAATGEEGSLNDLTSYSLEDLLGGVTFGDTIYILKQTTPAASREDARQLLGMTWSDIETSVPLVSKEGSYYGTQVYANGQLPAMSSSGMRTVMVITTEYWRERVYGDPDYFQGRNDAGRAAVLFENGKGYIKCWRYGITGQGREQFYMLNKTVAGLFPYGQGTSDIYKVCIISAYDNNNVTIVDPSNESETTYTWASAMENFSSLPSLANNATYTNDSYGISVKKLETTSYANRDLVIAVQQAENGYAEQIAFDAEVSVSGGDRVILTDDYLASQYLNIHNNDIPKRTEALTISVSGLNILDGLKTIANTFECEYWVEFDNDYTKEYKSFKLHFGKCQYGGEMIVSDAPYTDEEKQHEANAQSITSNGDDTDKGNKIYVFGGNENMPFTYRRVMRAEVIAVSDSLTVRRSETQTVTLTGHKFVKLRVNNVSTDPKGYLSTSFFPKPVNGTIYLSSINAQQTLAYMGKYVDETHNIYRYYFCCKGESFSIIEGMYERSPYRAQDNTIPTFTFVNQAGTIQNAKVSFGSAFLMGGGYRFPVWVNAAREQTITLTGSSAINLNSGYNTEGTFFLSGEVTPCLMVIVQTTSAVSNEALFARSIISCTNVVNNNAKILIRRHEEVIYSDRKYAMVAMKWSSASGNEEEMVLGVLNPANVTEPVPFSADSGCWWMSVPDFPFVAGDFIKIANATANTPLAYFIQDSDNPASLLQLGDNRLLLPANTDPDDSNYWDRKNKPQFVCQNGYIVPYNMRYIDNGNKTIERAVVFNKEYPKLKLVVGSVVPQLKNEYTDADNSQYQRQWKQYTLTLKNTDGSSFAFSKEWISDQKLKIRFLVPEDVAEFKDENGNVAGYSYENVIAKNCKLAGMQFEVEYDSTNNTYTIARNEDFGAKLPNEILFPSVGDPVVLVNWNTAAITATGIVEKAENSLMKKGFDYAKALAEDNFALNIEMMSTWMFLLAGEYDTLIDSQDKILVEAQNKVLKARRGLDKYFIPEIGHRVCVKHGSLKNGEKHTRILGYELKLDKPYDTPKLTVGESEAYSRLKQLEKEITKLS